MPRSPRHTATLRREVRAAKKVPCADCGNRYDPIAMDFDHVRGEKHGSVARMVRDGCSLARVLAEIEKCEVVCATCHRLRHKDAPFWTRA